MTVFCEAFNTVLQSDLADIGPGFFLLGFELGGSWIAFAEVNKSKNICTLICTFRI